MASYRMTELERQDLVRIVSEGERDDVDYAISNARFHSAIPGGAHNKILSGTLADLKLRTLPWRVAQLRVSIARVQVRAEHHDGDEATRLMRTHMAASFMGLVEIVCKTGSTAGGGPVHHGPASDMPS